MKTTNALHAGSLKTLFIKLALISLVAGAALLATPARANAQVAFGFRIGPARVGVYAPGPAYDAPTYGYYAPAPAYYAPEPVYAAPAYGYYTDSGYGRHEAWTREHGDFDHRHFDHDRRDFDRRNSSRYEEDRRDEGHHERDEHRGWDRQ